MRSTSPYNACLKTMGYTYDFWGREEERSKEVRTMAALCSRAGILLTLLLTRLAGDRMCVPLAFCQWATRWSPVKRYRAFLDHCTRGALRDLSSDSGCHTWKSTVTRCDEERVPSYSFLYCDTDSESTTPYLFLLHYDRVIAELYAIFLLSLTAVTIT